MEGDKAQCESWKDEVQNLLIFVSSTLAKEIQFFDMLQTPSLGGFVFGRLDRLRN